MARLEYARWHTCLNCAKVRFEDVAFLWEADGQIAAFLMPGPGETHVQVHPAWETSELVEEMLGVAEDRLATARADGSRKLRVWAAPSRRMERLPPSALSGSTM